MKDKLESRTFVKALIIFYGILCIYVGITFEWWMALVLAIPPVIQYYFSLLGAVKKKDVNDTDSLRICKYCSSKLDIGDEFCWMCGTFVGKNITT